MRGDLRTLFLIPIIHTPADMGFAREAIQEIKEKMFGREWARGYEEAVDRFWDEVKQRISQLKIDRVYNDSLPLGGEEGKKLVGEIAEGGSRNYQLLCQLVAKGAQLEATENLRLLQEEVSSIESILNAKSLAEKEEIAEKQKQRLLERIEERDRYIAQRINESLKEGERGIIFLGASHHIDDLLDEDITVVKVMKSE